MLSKITGVELHAFKYFHTWVEIHILILLVRSCKGTREDKVHGDATGDKGVTVPGTDTTETPDVAVVYPLNTPEIVGP